MFALPLKADIECRRRQPRLFGFDDGGSARNCHSNAEPLEKAAAGSWYNPFSGASVISRRSPELHPVEARRGFFVDRLSRSADV